MASDEVIWDILAKQFCSFKLTVNNQNNNFCRNEYNVTGFCSKQACPLANSRYATIRSNATTGQLYLYIKTPERSHMPNRWWEKIKLHKDYAKALAQIDKNLIYWPKFLQHKCKQRLTRLTQVALRMKRLQKEDERIGEKMVPRLANKVRRREDARERKALSAAKVERQIERVLIERLRSGAYGDRPMNVDEQMWQRVLKRMEKSGEGTRDQELSDEEEEEEEEGEYEMEKEPGVGEIEYVSDLEESDDEEDMGDFEDWMDGESPDEESGEEDDSEEDESEEGEDEGEDDDTEALKKAVSDLKRKRPSGPPPKANKKDRKDRKGPKMEIEYEVEREPVRRQAAYA